MGWVRTGGRGGWVIDDDDEEEEDEEEDDDDDADADDNADDADADDDDDSYHRASLCLFPALLFICPYCRTFHF